MKPCPTGCGRKMIDRVFMCAPCWAAVPPELQKPVWSARRALDHAMTRAWDRRSIDTLRRELAEARAAAIEAAKKKVLQKELAL